LDEDRKELGIKIMKITKSNENVAVKHEDNVRTQNPKLLLSVKNHRLVGDARSITTCRKYLNGKYF